MDSDVDALVLEDGTELRPVVHETGCEYAVDLIVCRPTTPTREES
jgi:hypothetical protein